MENWIQLLAVSSTSSAARVLVDGSEKIARREVARCKHTDYGEDLNHRQNIGSFLETDFLKQRLKDSTSYQLPRPVH